MQVGSALESLAGEESLAAPSRERRNEIGIVPALFKTPFEVLLHAERTFVRMPRFTDRLGALIYAAAVGAACCSILVLAYLVLEIGCHPRHSWAAVPRLFIREVTGLYRSAMTFCLLAPFIALAVLLFASVLFHLSLNLFSGVRCRFLMTLKTVCYAGGSAALFLLLPSVVAGGGLLFELFVGAQHFDTGHGTIPLPVLLYLGTLAAVLCIAGIWFAIVVAMGFGEVHEGDVFRLQAAATPPMLLYFFFVVVWGVVILSIVAAHRQ